jgi:phosphatidylglycerophosphate synthase
MKHKIKVDYHFHPNLPIFIPVFQKWLRPWKAHAVWKGFKDHNLDVVFITEHSYKSPKLSFEILEKHRPKNAKALLIPAVEALTKEGIDILVFSKNKRDIYSQKRLLCPYEMTMDEVVELITKNKKLHGIVVHPFTPGTTSIVDHLGEKKTKEIIEKLKMVEIHNYSFASLQKWMKKFGLNKIFKKLHKKIGNTTKVPARIIPKNTILTGGSDAHQVSVMGDYMEIEIEKGEDLFEVVTKKTGKGHSIEKSPLFMSLCIISSMKEFLIKKLGLYKLYHKVERSMEKTLALKSRKLRSKISNPFIKLLAKTGVTPNMLSYSGVILMVGYIIMIVSDPWTAFALLLFALFIDGFLDGALARYLGTDSDKGKFVDQVCDITVFVIFILGVARLGLVNILMAILFVYVVSISKLFVVIKKNIGQKTDWVIHPFVGVFSNLPLYLSYLLFTIWLIYGINYMNQAIIVFTAGLIIKAIFDLHIIVSKKL